jgi:hypothetical protein
LEPSVNLGQPATKPIFPCRFSHAGIKAELQSACY